MTEQTLNDLAFYGAIFGPMLLFLAISVARLVREIRRAP